MKEHGKELLSIFDWLAPFYEKSLPKWPPKIPTVVAMSHAAELAYDKNPADVPERFLQDFYKGLPRKERREIAIRRIAKFGIKHAPGLERYMAEEYDVLVVHRDGDLTSRGKRIITNDERAENADAARYQGDWGHAHCNGTHAAEDFTAEQINRLQPAAAIERRKLVGLPLPAPEREREPILGPDYPRPISVEEATR